MTQTEALKNADDAVEKGQDGLDRQRQLIELEGRIDKHRANVAEGGKELSRLEGGYQRAAQAQAAEIRAITDNVADLSAKGVVDAVLKTKDIGGLERLKESIGKIKNFIAIEKGALVRVTKEKDSILAEIESEEVDRMTAAVCDCANRLIAKYHELEPLRQELFSLASDARARDPRYFDRVVDLGYPAAFLVVLDSILRPENATTMNVITLLNRIAAVTGYGQPLISKDAIWEDVPLVRDSFYQKSITIQ